MDKLEYISRQLSKAEHKKYEHYVVTRIWHLLDDLTLKFVTQQYITRPEGRAMTDMFFPQLSIHIEVDEGFHKKQIEWDRLRENDIINATGHEILRVDVTQKIDCINNSISDIVRKIKEKKTVIRDFKSWDIDAEHNPQTYITKGNISINDDCSFSTIVDAVACFGKQYKKNGIWKGGVKHPKEPDKLIWFPKLYKNKTWNNSISYDENTIIEINEDLIEAEKHVKKTLENPNIQRVVFARVKSPLGDIMYRFKGVYKLDTSETSISQGLIWKRIAESINTYSIL